MITISKRILLIAAVIGLAACSGQERAVVKPAEPARHPAGFAASRQQQVSILRRKVVALMEKKSYRQAIELMNDKNREGLEKEYVLDVNGLLEVGNDAYASGDFAAAARTFKFVLNEYPLESSLRERLSHDPKRIRALLETCKGRLMEQGLDEYRQGNLENAISKWKLLLAISPGHQEAKKAVETAKVQLQTLQSMKDI